MEFNIEKYHLKSSSFFDYLDKEEARLVKSKMLRKEYSKGEFLFKEKSFSKGVYFIRKGKVKIFQTNSEGKQSIVYIYKKGDYFGYRPILAEESHPVSAMAMDNVVVNLLPKEHFKNLLNKSSTLSAKLLTVLSKEFSVWINKMTTFTHYAVKERVALSLLILHNIYARNDLKKNKKTSIMIGRDDFAGFVGTAKETLVRTLRFYKDYRYIISTGTKIQIINKKGLIDIVTELL